MQKEGIEIWDLSPRHISLSLLLDFSFIQRYLVFFPYSHNTLYRGMYPESAVKKSPDICPSAANIISK